MSMQRNNYLEDTAKINKTVQKPNPFTITKCNLQVRLLSGFYHLRIWNETKGYLKILHDCRVRMASFIRRFVTIQSLHMELFFFLEIFC